MNNDDMKDRMECQICERKIKAKKGVIAHHGYTRPNQGGWTYQTASCAGALELPYEKSCALIPAYIESVKAHLERLEKIHGEYITELPATITRRTQSPYQKNKMLEYSEDRPEGMTLENIWGDEWKWKSGNYRQMYKNELADLERAIKDTKHDLNHLNDRVANWVLK